METKTKLLTCVGKKLPQKSLRPMSASVQKWLEGHTPAQFLSLYNPDLGAQVLQSGRTSGEIARREDIPTLAAVAQVYDEATAIAWLAIEIDSIDVMQGASAYNDVARKDAARLILSRYADMNVSELLRFFTLYKLGEFHEQTSHVGGVQKLLLALRLYRIRRDDDIRRLEREELNLAAAREREQWAAKAISYDEYIKSKNDTG